MEKSRVSRVTLARPGVALEQFCPSMRLNAASTQGGARSGDAPAHRFQHGARAFGHDVPGSKQRGLTANLGAIDCQAHALEHAQPVRLKIETVERRGRVDLAA